MKILILGAGQVGRTAAQHLSREEANEVTVVDLNEDMLRELQDRLDVRTVAGNAAFPTVLEAAGTAEADILVALTSSDEVNMLACEIAFTLFRTPTKIARIRAAEYTDRAALFGADALAVDVWISPEQLVTEYVAATDLLSRGRCRCWSSPTAGCVWSACGSARAACWSGGRCASCASTLPEARGARRRDLPRRPQRGARRRHRHRGRRRGVLPGRARGYPPYHERDAPRRGSGTAHRDRRRRQHRLPARQDAGKA